MFLLGKFDNTNTLVATVPAAVVIVVGCLLLVTSVKRRAMFNAIGGKGNCMHDKTLVFLDEILLLEWNEKGRNIK